MASAGIGLGFQALLGQSENALLAKGTVTLVLIIALVIFLAACPASRKALSRLDSDSAEPLASNRLGVVAALFSAGVILPVVTLWVL